MPVLFSWPLTAPPAPVVSSGGGSGVVVGADASSTVVTVRGLLRPFRRDGVSDFASGTGMRLIRSKIGQILGTRCSNDRMEGELPWRPEFGALLHLIRHRNGDGVTRELARTYVEDALRLWLPSIRVTYVDTLGADETGVEGAMTVRVYFQIRNQAGLVSEDMADVALPALA